MDVSKKAAKRKRQRLRRKEKSLENSLKENQSEAEEVEVAREEMNQAEKSKEQVLAERQAKKAAKLVKKTLNDPTTVAPQKEQAEKPAEKKPSVKVAEKSAQVVQAPPAKPQEIEKGKDQVHAEREARKLAKQAAKKKEDGTAPKPVHADKKPESKVVPKKPSVEAEIVEKLEQVHITSDAIQTNVETDKAKTMSKTERRAKQEAQRAAKAKAIEDKKVVKATPKKVVSETPSKKPQASPQAQKTAIIPKVSALHKVKLFKHLYSDKCDLNINVNQNLHPAIVKLGLQYQSDEVVGSNARCYAFLNAMKILINDYVTPLEKDFSRGLEAEIQPAVEFLQNCRPFAVSMTNALKYIKVLISLETSNENDDDKKHRLVEKIDTYASDQIETAARSISLKVREKISNGDVILTYGCSSLIKRTLIEAYRDSELKFRVIVVDARPDHEGQEMLKALTMLGINCTYVLINAISFIMPEVTKVLLGAHALLANGFVMSRVGTAQIALVANSYNVPVLVCCETHKFSERVQTDAFVFNELGNPNALVTNKNTRETFDHLKDWENIPHLTPLNLRYDVTPPELVTAVVTEVAILPCTSVQVILRVKPAE